MAKEIDTLQNLSLVSELKQIIVAAKQQAQITVNTQLTLLYWQIGEKIQNHTLNNARADYGKQVIKQLASELTQEFGKGFNEKSLRRMLQFYQSYPEQNIVATLSRQLSWSHFVELLTIKHDTARDFYAQMAMNDRWSVRTLRDRMDGMLFERTAISKQPDELIQLELQKLNKTNKSELSTELLLKDPYLLDFLGVKDHYLEKDLEDAILRELELFLLELGSGFSFIGRQHRIQIGQEDFYIDLLFYNRKLKRLVAIDLKLGKFQAAYKGQMELYLRYLAKFEQEPDEQPPLGIILCASKDDEQVELLELDQSGIHVAEYLTALPPKALLQQKLHQAIQNNQQRLASKEGDE
jgi:predicted nuclease of restriction endonuclease-like (RecB) superfamily